MQQDLRQQTEEILREVYKDGYKKEEVIVIEDKESAIKLSEEERRGLNKLKEHIRTDPTITAVYIYELSRLSRRQLVLFSIRDFLIEHNIQLICLKPYFKLLEPDGKMSQTGSLMFSIFSSMSESEMALAKERMMRGRKFNIAMGKSGEGRTPFGYTRDKDKGYVIQRNLFPCFFRPTPLKSACSAVLRISCPPIVQFRPHPCSIFSPPL